MFIPNATELKSSTCARYNMILHSFANFSGYHHKSFYNKTGH